MNETGRAAGQLLAERVEAAGVKSNVLVALVLGQIGLHAAMAGARMSMPLLVLRSSETGWFSGPQAVGFVLAFFAIAPVLTAMPAGRWVDRRGYHKPVRAAVMMSMLGGALACLAVFFGGWLQALLLLGAALTAGAGANLGFIAILRKAGRMAQGAGEHANATELKRVFAWMGLAPSISNAFGPMLAGGLIDGMGFVWAFGAMAALPILTLLAARLIPSEPVVAPVERLPVPSLRVGVVSLLTVPGMGRLMAVNWFFSASWDLHTLMVPLLGHELGLSASAIGSVLGSFAIAVTMVRMAVPLVTRYLSEVRVLTMAFLAVAAVFAVYPLSQTATAMAVCAVFLGIALGVVQPLIMTTLHHLAPADRQGEAIALRSALINLSSSTLPLAFGALGASVGAGMMFRVMALIVVSGVCLPRDLAVPVRHDP